MPRSNVLAGRPAGRPANALLQRRALGYPGFDQLNLPRRQRRQAKWHAADGAIGRLVQLGMAYQQRSDQARGAIRHWLEQAAPLASLVQITRKDGGMRRKADPARGKPEATRVPGPPSPPAASASVWQWWQVRENTLLFTSSNDTRRVSTGRRANAARPARAQPPLPVCTLRCPVRPRPRPTGRSSASGCRA